MRAQYLLELINKITPQDASLLGRAKRNFGLFFSPETFMVDSYEYAWWRLRDFGELIKEAGARELTLEEVQRLAFIIDQEIDKNPKHTTLYKVLFAISLCLINETMQPFQFSRNVQSIKRVSWRKIVSVLAVQDETRKFELLRLKTKLSVKVTPRVKKQPTIQQLLLRPVPDALKAQPCLQLVPKPDLQIENVVICLDADNCAFNLIYRKMRTEGHSEEKCLEAALEALFQHILLLLKTKPGKRFRIILVSNSARYDYFHDNHSATVNDTARWFPTLEIVKTLLEKALRAHGFNVEVELDKFLLRDVFHESKEDEHFDAVPVIDLFSDNPPELTPFDESKLLLFYRHLHHYAERFKKEGAHLLVYDDLSHMMQGLRNFFSDPIYCGYIPPKIKCSFFRYGNQYFDDEAKFDGSIEPIGILKGTAKSMIDVQWRGTLQHLMRYVKPASERFNLVDELNLFNGNVFNRGMIGLKQAPAAVLQIRDDSDIGVRKRIKYKW